MKKFILLPLIFFVIGRMAFASVPEALMVKEYKLSNGLTVWLNEDHSQPKVFGAVVIKAGAKDCPNTGIAHYFEHMMFKGTDKIGTIDYKAEKVFLDSISQKYDELSLAKNDSSRLKIQTQINTLSIKAAKYAIPNEFDRLISKYGGTGLNAYTSYDNTVYHNSFSPQYFNQWAEICSERIINPVFRLFQSELETVYEEKNMYEDQLLNPAFERVLDKFFSPHPYAYPIVGSTANLKNPKLSDMKQFFRDYYVAGNMGLILSGDFKTEEVLPVLESTFARIQTGEAPKKIILQPKPIKGVESMDILLKIPLIKMSLLAWRGVPSGNPDEVSLEILSGLLTNESSTGLLDKLTSDGKLLQASMMHENMKEAGLIYALVLPKIAFQSNESAIKKVLQEIDKLKSGDFSEETMTSLKMEIKRRYETELEDISSRSSQMVNLFTQGKTWEQHLNEINAIDAITKDDIIKVANKYFTADYMVFNKKTGSYPKDNLQKPPFAPIVPPNKEAKSLYADKLTQMSVNQVPPRFLDFNKDVTVFKLAPKATLYISPNPVNSIFTIKLNYLRGTRESKLAEALASYLNFLGTDSITLDKFKAKLQKLGSSISFGSTRDNFSIDVTGFDENLEPTLELVSDFMKNVKADDKQLKNIIDAFKIRNKSERENPDDMAGALLNKVVYGEKSEQLDRLSLNEIKKIKGAQFVDEFKKLTKVECDMSYCGNIPVSTVENLFGKYLFPQKCTIATNFPVYDEFKPVKEPVIYFMNAPKSSQSIVMGYINGGINNNLKSRHEASLYNNYFGGSMSSMLFQEIREFRSMAYRVGANYLLTDYCHRDKPGFLKISLSTQCDKTTDAIQVLDSLIKDMPLKPERIETSKSDLMNTALNSYPSFRDISNRISRQIRSGYTSDPNESLLEDAASMTIENVADFYKQNVKGRPVAYIVVGNEKQVDMKKLAAFGKVVTISVNDVFR
jgi:predicted Zn-dependent peptidase